MKLSTVGCLALSGAVLTLSVSAQAQNRPSESSMFGEEARPVAPPSPVRQDEAAMFEEEGDGGTSVAPTADGGTSSFDAEQFSGTESKSKFDTNDVVSDPIRIGGNLLMTAQLFAREGVAFADESISAPFILDAFLDSRPTDRLRAFALARLQFDPTRPTSAPAPSTTTSTAGSGTVGLTGSGATNPNVQLDQLWLRFDIARKVYLTVGRQKIRWGTARVWFPTDYLNSRPRDPLNPFDARLGVNMVKVHVPVESKGWNFYGYGLLDNIAPGASGLTVERLAGALRAEFVFGKTEIGLGGIWQKGRRPRYAVDFSSAVGPLDIYGEVAIRQAPDFLKYNIPDDVTLENFVSNVSRVTAYRPQGVTAQTSLGVSYQFNYTDEAFGIVSAEYFFNPLGYKSPAEYLVQTFLPQFTGAALDPLQQTSLYGGQHSLALTAVAPNVGGLTWVTLSLANILNFSDPSGLVRFDAIFRVLTQLNVQAFASVFYGQTSGEIRFKLPESVVNDIVSATPVEQRAATAAGLKPLQNAPLLQAGVLLRLSI